MSAPDNPFPRLPHGAPFLLLDRVLDVSERSGVFVKHVAAADPCVGRDGTLPAAFVLEALAQAGGALLSALRGGGPERRVPGRRRRLPRPRGGPGG